MFYIPILPYAFYLGLKARSTTFMSAVNPGIKNSGNGTESKYKTLELIPDKYKPRSILISKQRDFDTVIKTLHKAGIDYPLIAKPDIGFRGMLVKKIYSDTVLKSYLNKYPIAIILQEFIDLPYECGVFYYKCPNEEKGTINSLTLKSFLKVTGDGKTAIIDLIKEDERAVHYMDYIKLNDKINLNSILEKGKNLILSEIGNHAKGTQFINGNHLISEKLIATFNNVKEQLDGWDYGRLDIKYNSFEELEKGEKFVILEINGTIAEPTHIYDAEKSTYFEALKTLKKHWKIIYEISKTNKQNGIKVVPFLPFWKAVYQLKEYSKDLINLAKTNS